MRKKFLEIKAKQRIFGEIWPTKVADLSRADFEIGQWSVPEVSDKLRWGCPHCVSTHCVLTLNPEVLEAIHRPVKPFIQGNHDIRLPFSHETSKDTGLCRVSATVSRDISYRGIARAKQCGRYDRVRQELLSAMDTESEPEIDRAIEQMDRSLQQWVDYRRRQYLLTVHRVAEYKSDKMIEEAGLSKLLDDLEKARAVVNDLHSKLRDQWLAYLTAQWEAEERYPAEFKEKLLELLRSRKARTPFGMSCLFG